MGRNALQVIVADDHALIRQGLIAVLHAHEPEWVLREGGSIAEVTALLEERAADLAVLDLRMPGMKSGRTLRDLRARWPKTLLVVLTGVDERASILECLEAGVHGYMLKSAATTHLVEALRSVVGGAMYVPPELARGTDDRIVAAAPPAATQSFTGQSFTGQSFTGRQQEVLELLAEGRSTKEIARTLNLGVGTVKVHLSAIYRALGAHNRMEAVMRAGALRG